MIHLYIRVETGGMEMQSDMYRRQKRDSREERQKFECESCGFKFSSNPRFKKIDCPWCGHGG